MAETQEEKQKLMATALVRYPPALRDALRLLVAIHGLQFLDEFYERTVARLELDRKEGLLEPLQAVNAEFKRLLKADIEWVRREPKP